MSIIERAIQKLQGANPAGAAGPVKRDASARRIRETGTPVSDRARPVREPARSISIDLARLSAQGAIPRPDAEGRSQQEFRHIKRAVLEAVVAGRSAASDAFSNLLMVTSSIAGE